MPAGRRLGESTRALDNGSGHHLRRQLGANSVGVTADRQPPSHSPIDRSFRCEDHVTGNIANGRDSSAVDHDAELRRQSANEFSASKRLQHSGDEWPNIASFSRVESAQRRRDHSAPRIESRIRMGQCGIDDLSGRLVEMVGDDSTDLHVGSRRDLDDS